MYVQYEEVAVELRSAAQRNGHIRRNRDDAVAARYVATGSYELYSMWRQYVVAT
jgi:hypothetical protein